VLRRADIRSGRGTLRIGELAVDPLSRDVRLADRAVQLSAKEFALLYALATEPTRVFTKAELLHDVWGYMTPGATRTLDTHACRIRQKLSGAERQFVITVRGVGYKLTEAL
jgi:DNA-binding response OmpR family regulator